MSSSVVKNQYAIVGVGGLGGYYGGRLHHAGHAVHFLLHSDYEQVRRQGLRVESVHGDFSIISPHAYSRAQDMPRCDVVLVGLKSTQNGVLPQVLPYLVKPGGAVLMMQNGLGIEEQVAKVVPSGVEIFGGLAFLCSHKVGPGHIRHMDYGHIRFGAYRGEGLPAGVPPLLRAVAEDFRRAGLPVDVEGDLLGARWKKLVWNVPYNGLSVVMRSTTERLMAHPQMRALCQSLMREVVAGAAAFGRAIDEAFVQKMLTDTDTMVAYKPSMLLDYERGQPMEIEAIYGNPVRAAAARGCAMPRVQMLYEQLKFLDATSSPDVR